MTKILLIRHGQVEGINPPRFRGRTDLALTEQGIAQADSVARRMAAQWMPNAVYTSPMARCVKTGAIIAEACGVSSSSLQVFNDIDYGEWQWKTYEDARLESPVLFSRWFAAPHLVRFPGGESLQDLVARASDALRFIMERHSHETVVLVGHDSVNRALLLQLLDQTLSAFWRLVQTPCAINEIDIHGIDVTIKRINETTWEGVS